MTMSLRKLQSHIGIRWSSNEGRNDSSWARHLHTAEQPLTDQLQALEKELQTLAAWESNGAISSAERGAQTSRLLASKLPLPDGHGPEALATMQAVDRWKVEGYLSEEECAARRAQVLNAAAAGKPSSVTAQGSFGSHNAHHPTVSAPLDTAAHCSPSGQDSSRESTPSTHTKNVLMQACRITRGKRGSRENLSAPGGLQWTPSPSSAPMGSAKGISMQHAMRRGMRSHWPKPESPLVESGTLPGPATPPVLSADAPATDAKVSFQLPDSMQAESGVLAGGGVSADPESALRSPTKSSPSRSRPASPPMSGKSTTGSVRTNRRLSNEERSGDDRSERARRWRSRDTSSDDLLLNGADLTDLDQLLSQLRKGTDRHYRRHLSASSLLAQVNYARESTRGESANGKGRCRWLYIPTFDPDNRLVILWQLLIFAFVICSAIVVPLMVAFEAEMPLETREALDFTDFFFDASFLFDILVSSNIAFRKDGFLITVRRLVVVNYLKTWFLLDFVSSFPLSWILPPSDEGTAAGEISRINKLLRLVKLGKLLRILKLFKIFDRLAESVRFNPASFRLLTLAISLFFMSHLFGCLWYMVLSWGDGTLHDYDVMRNESDTITYMREQRYPLDELLDANALGTGGVGRKWLLCFTWAMGLFTGLMPVELQPWREEEMVFTIVALVFAMAFNAMIISACSSAMAAMDYIARHHKAKLDRVRDYMRFNAVPADLRATIMEFYRYICLNSQTQDDLKDFVDLPQQLHFKLAIALHRELITKCPLFSEFDNLSILRILSFLRPITLPPETVVLRQGQEHAAMYFVSRGMLWAVENLGTPTERLVGALGSHEFFGDEAMLSGAPPLYSVVSKTYCVLMALTQQDFDTACPRLKGGKTLREVTGRHSSISKALPRLSKVSQPPVSTPLGGARLKSANSKKISLVGVVRAVRGAAGAPAAAPAAARAASPARATRSATRSTTRSAARAAAPAGTPAAAPAAAPASPARTRARAYSYPDASAPAPAEALARQTSVRVCSPTASSERRRAETIARSTSRCSIDRA